MSAGASSRSILTLLLCLLPILGLSHSSDDSPPATTIPQGRLQGDWFTTRGGRRIAAFRSIPYAQPPLDELRFKSPQPPLPWEGVYSATEEAPGCIQAPNPQAVPIRPTSVSEDCLYLNVYTHDISSIKPCPVIIFISGGNFETGSGNSSAYGPHYLLDEPVVHVSFNYRLGILGFLSLECAALPGNLGLKDQRAAMRWVKSNIKYFGGDPEKITIFGESAGAAAVQFHAMFNNKEGLFRAGICHSGAAMSPISFQWPETQRPLVERLANITNCPRGPEDLLECMRKIPALEFETLRQTLAEPNAAEKKNSPVFTPVLEPLCVQDALITGNPWNTSYDVPMIQGVNQHEALFRLVGFETNKNDSNFMDLNENFTSIIPKILYIENSVTSPEEVAVMLRKYYFEDSQVNRDNYMKLVNLVTDGIYNYALTKSARLNKGIKFIYHLNYQGSNTIVRYLGSDQYYGVSHADDLFYMFPCGGPTARNVTEADIAFSRKLIKLWTNFATYLDPTPSGIPSVIGTRWEPAKSSSIEFLNITQNSFRMENNFFVERMDFWEQVPLRKN